MNKIIGVLSVIILSMMLVTNESKASEEGIAGVVKGVAADVYEENNNDNLVTMNTLGYTGILKGESHFYKSIHHLNTSGSGSVAGTSIKYLYWRTYGLDPIMMQPATSGVLKGSLHQYE